MLDKAKKYSWIMSAISKLKWSTKKEVITHFLTSKKKYIPKKKTNADVDNILKCALCPNMCRFDCPVLRVEKSETSSPSGKARIAYLVEMNRLNFSDDVIDLMYKCASCDACKEWCPFDFSLGELLIGVRKDIVEKGLVPSSLTIFKEKLEENHTIYGEGITSLGLEAKRGDVLYFAGCTTLNKRKEVANANIKILEKAGINFTTLSNEWCCGAPLSILGFGSDFKKFAEHNIKAIRESGCKTMICGCPECVHTFKELYPRIGLKLNVEILHTSQFLLRLVEEGKIKMKHLKEEYVYHDPCVLSRKLNICEEPRELLKNIPELKLKKAQFDRKETRCCGMGGMLGVTNPKISLEMAKNRVSGLREACNSIVTACPTCELAFKNVNKKLRVLDLSELILETMEE